MDWCRLDRTNITCDPYFSIAVSCNMVVSQKILHIIRTFPHHPSSPKLSRQLACSRPLLLSEFSCTRIISVGPHLAIEALLEAKDNCEAHNKESNTPANGAEVTLRLIRIGDALKVHSKVRLQGFWSQHYYSEIGLSYKEWSERWTFSRNVLQTRYSWKIRGVQSEG